MKNSLELLLLELLFNKKTEAPPKKKHTGDLTVKQIIKVMKVLPEYKRDFEEALKALEPKNKDKDKLTLGQRYMMWTLAAVTLPPLYVALIHALFTTISGK